MLIFPQADSDWKNVVKRNRIQLQVNENIMVLSEIIL